MSGLRRMTAMRPAKLEYLSMLSKQENTPGIHSQNAMDKARNAYQVNHSYNTYTRSQNYKNNVKRLQGGRRTRKVRRSRKARHSRKH
jgi:hypothetical protein